VPKGLGFSSSQLILKAQTVEALGVSNKQDPRKTSASAGHITDKKRMPLHINRADKNTFTA
jgi:hypothetical protein